MATHSKLRAWREAKRLTLKVVAARIGVTESAVSRWETGVNIPGSDDLAKFARAIGVPDEALACYPSDWNRQSDAQALMDTFIALGPDERAQVTWFARRLANTGKAA